MISISAMFPVHISKNLKTLRDFYIREFGFEAVFFEEDFYTHLLHPGTGIQLGFLLPGHASQPGFLHQASTGSGALITFEVENAREAFATAESAKLDIVLDYTVEPWGQEHFILRDPEGNMIDILQKDD